MKKRYFSIIIPMYNVEKYLKECVDSILVQDFEDYQIILIDDGSTDNTGKIVDEYYGDNKKIKIIHQTNGGLSEARNKGIKEADGKYIIFVDSDDYWDDSNALTKIYNKIEKDNNDVVVIGYKKYFESTGNTIEKNKYHFSDKDSIEKLLETNYFKACAWDKIVKSDILRKENMLFPKGLLSEDIIWCSNLINEAENIGALEENFYIYRQREGSITKTIKEKNILDMLQMINEGKKNDNYINLSFLAYEYSVTLGLISTKNSKKIITKETKEKVYKLKNILKYNLNKKVKKVYFLSKIIGIKLTSYVLGKFIDIK